MTNNLIVGKKLSKGILMSLPPLVALLLYATAGPIVPQQSVWTTIMLGIIGLYAVFATIAIPKTKVVRIVILFVLVQAVYYFTNDSNTHSMLGMPSASGQIKAIIMNFLPFFIAFFLSWKGFLKKDGIIIYSILYLILLIPKYFYDAEQQLQIFYLEDQTTINTGYYFVEVLVLLPLIQTRKYLSLLTLSLILFFSLLSAKRGSMVLAAVFLIFFIPQWLKTSRRNSFLIIVGIIAVTIIGLDYFREDAYLMTRIDQTAMGRSSGRDDIYNDIWKYCMVDHFSINTLLFGFGFNSSLKMTINMAHNDWLELLSCCGLLGISLYIVFFVQNLRECWNFKNDKALRLSLLLLTIMWFVKTFFSMAYTSLWYMPLMLGFLLGNKEYYKNNKYKQLKS